MIELLGLLGRASLFHLAGEAASAGHLADQVQARAEERSLVFISAAAGLLKTETLLARRQPETAAELAGCLVERARSWNHIWLEIEGLGLVCRAQSPSGWERTQARARLKELLDGLVSGTTHPELRQHVAVYRQKKLAQVVE
jgi:hypothetical protein